MLKKKNNKKQFSNKYSLVRLVAKVRSIVVWSLCVITLEYNKLFFRNQFRWNVDRSDKLRDYCWYINGGGGELCVIDGKPAICLVFEPICRVGISSTLFCIKILRKNPIPSHNQSPGSNMCATYVSFYRFLPKMRVK